MCAVAGGWGQLPQQMWYPKWGIWKDGGSYIVRYSRKLAGAELCSPGLLPWRVGRNVQRVTKQSAFTADSCHPGALQEPQAERKREAESRSCCEEDSWLSSGCREDWCVCWGRIQACTREGSSRQCALLSVVT